MLVNCDVKGLEVVVAAELSQDPVLMSEVREGKNFHEDNRVRFGLPDRVTAKRFKFKLLYGATAFGYAHDGDFTSVSTSERFWQGIIDEYYDKYRGIRTWHSHLIDTAIREKQLEIPSGRIFPIAPDYTKREPWPHTIIKNYPVQGFGADLVMLARLQANKLLKAAGVEAVLISTIHDSIVVDCPEKCVAIVGKLLKQSVEDVPMLCKQIFGYAFSLPMTAEVQYGPNKKDMVEMKFDN